MTRQARLLNVRDALAASPPVASSGASQPRAGVGKTRKPVQFSLFYFDGKEGALADDKYRLLVEGAKFADEHGFTAVWTPERHFHEFGGLYPNPAITSAAVAMITRQVQIRAGSVVIPLHHHLRVAEEWAAVDNLSHGRVGISFASGWHADDFALAPQNYLARKARMIGGIETVRRLWRGDSEASANGLGKMVELRTFPKPMQRELPVWVTCSGNPETFILAGEVGGGVLTHLLGQSIDELAEKITLYRNTLVQSGHDAAKGTVTLMLHTFIGESLEEVRQKVREPFCEYLLSAIDLIQRQLEHSAATGAGSSANPWRKAASLRSDQSPAAPRTAELSENEKRELAAYGFDRYFNTAALFGTRESCLGLLNRLAEIGVDEIACLIDFGVDVESALGSLRHLSALKDLHGQEILSPEKIHRDVEQLDLDYWVYQLRDTVSVAPNSVLSEALNSADYLASQVFTVRAELSARLDQLREREGVTMFVLLLTAFQALLRRYGSRDDISVGTCLSLATPAQAGDGETVNTLVLRATITDDIGFGDLLRQARSTAAEALDHHNLPFRKLRESLGANETNQLFSHAFLFLQDAPLTVADPAWFVDILKKNSGGNEYQSVLAIWPDGQKLQGVFCGNAREYEAELMNQMPAHFQSLLEDVAAESPRPVSELAIISGEESVRLSNDFNAAL